MHAHWVKEGGLRDCRGVRKGLGALLADNQELIGGSVVRELSHSSLIASCMGM